MYGVVGLGAMGAPMATNLLRAFPGATFVTSRRRESAAALEGAGAQWAVSPRELAARCQVVVVMVQDVPQTREVLEGPSGLLAGAGDDLVVVVSSSVSPTAVREIAAEAAQATQGRVRLVDAPVSGGVEGARAGSLSIMVGGDAEAYDLAEPALSAMGHPAHLGPLGAGQVAKGCNQMIVASTVVALAEAAVVAEANDLDVAAMFALLQGGYAGSRLLEVKGPQLAAHDHAPRGATGFMVKDLAVAAEAAQGHPLAQLPLLRAVFDDLVRCGLGDHDVSVVQEWLHDHAGSFAQVSRRQGEDSSDRTNTRRLS